MIGTAVEPSGRRSLAWFLVAVVLLQLAVWNARIGNADTYNQLVAVVHLVDTGSLGARADELPEPERRLLGSQWVRGDDGLRHQVHDPGNKVLMLPATVLSRVAGRQPSGDPRPTATTKVLVSATFVAAASLLPLFLYLALQTLLPRRRAMRWAVLGLVATLLLPYSKHTWDVFPCAVLVSGAAWASLRRLGPRPTWGHLVGLFAFAAGASWFRFSLAPFLLIGCVVVEVVAARRREDRAWPRAWLPDVAIGLAVFLVVLAPVLAVNAHITGNPLRPAVALPETNQVFEHLPLVGMLGLLASPNRGLLVFAPILAVAGVAAFRWRRQPEPLRGYLLGWSAPVLGYLLVVGSMDGWGRFGWGPRYLVPVVPLLWIPAAVVAARLLDRRGAARVAVVALLTVSAGVAAIGTLTSWDAVIGADPDVVAEDAVSPRQIVETARYTGRTIPPADDEGADGVDDGVDTRRWPDLAAVYASREAGLPDAFGILGVLTLLALSGAALVAADRSARRTGVSAR